MSDVDDERKWTLRAEGWVDGGSVAWNWPEKAVEHEPGDLEIWRVTYNVDSMYATPVSAVARRVWGDAEVDRPPRAMLWKDCPPPWRAYGSWFHEEPGIHVR